MTVSVLMSVYKSEKPEYLDRSLISIWDDQICKPDKIVLIQDGPIGNDLQLIIDKWVKKIGNCIILIVNEQNIGLTRSLNKGISIINTDLVARMDSDDISLPERFAKQKAYLEQNRDISIVGSYIREFKDDMTILGERKFPLDTEGAKKIIYKVNPLAHPAVMMRRDIFSSGIAYNENYRTSQDLALWFDILSAGYKIANIDTVLLLFRRNNDVYKRRSNLKDSFTEFIVHERGIKNLYGFSPYKSMFPIIRYIIRLLPVSFLRWLYNGNLRNVIVKQKS